MAVTARLNTEPKDTEAERAGTTGASNQTFPSKPVRPPRGPVGGAEATTAALGARGGIAWREHNDYTQANVSGITDGGYIGTGHADGAKDESQDELVDVPLGVSASGGDGDDSQVVIVVSDSTGGSAYVQATFSTDPTGADTVDHVEAYVYKDPAASIQEHELAQSSSGVSPLGAFDPSDYAEFHTTAAARAYEAKSTTYTSTTQITVTAGVKLMWLVPVMTSGKIGQPVAVASTAT